MEETKLYGGNEVTNTESGKMGTLCGLPCLFIRRAFRPDPHIGPVESSFLLVGHG